MRAIGEFMFWFLCSMSALLAIYAMVSMALGCAPQHTAPAIDPNPRDDCTTNYVFALLDCDKRYHLDEAQRCADEAGKTTQICIRQAQSTEEGTQ